MNSTDNPTPSTPPRPVGIGARFKAAREKMGLSEKDASLRMHLSIKFIHIMENEDFTNAPPATFMRGYLRSYARILNVSEHEVNHAIEQLGMNEPIPAIIPPLLHPQSAPRNERHIRWITYLVVVILLTLVGVWWSSHSNNKPKVAAPEAPVIAQPIPSATTPPVPTPIIENPAPPVTAPTQNMPAAAPAPQQPPTPPVSAPLPQPPITAPQTSLPVPATVAPSVPQPVKPHNAPIKMAAPEPELDTSDDGNY